MCVCVCVKKNQGIIYFSFKNIRVSHMAVATFQFIRQSAVINIIGNLPGTCLVLRLLCDKRLLAEE